jgi:hypothetical protein
MNALIMRNSEQSGGQKDKEGTFVSSNKSEQNNSKESNY